MTKPILITGSPRSGSSILAGTLALCGANGGRTNKMHENLVIRDMTANYMQVLDADEKGHYNFPSMVMFNSERWQTQINKVLQDHDMTDNWFYKDNRIAILWEMWNACYPTAEWIVVRRSDKHIINSCMKTHYMDTFASKTIQASVNVNSTEEGWQWMVNQYKNIFAIMRMNMNIKEIWLEKICETKDYTDIKNLVASLGLTWNAEAEKYLKEKLNIGRY